ncbi:MAG: DegT/DnrJ/EryC1/StrS family aminotransferase [Candidatus Latescibacterota bacterium]|nr:DegT/DnrJ/EryC1/StrS family aminotransferase [Candidatus Latescibacterota bacterium]
MFDDKLAIDGGTPIRTAPFPPRALFGKPERDAALLLFEESIETGSAIGYGGSQEQAYEQAFADFHGGGYADLVNSGTSALYAALGALELEPASEVVVPPITDPGGVMPVALLNLIPVPADAAPGTFNAGAEQIEAAMRDCTRAIIVAHIAGESADMDPILELAAARDLPVIEDCAQAHGALYKGRLTGTMGVVGVYSTMSGKHHATGPQGGVVYTQDEDLIWRCRRFSDRGKPFQMDCSSNVRAGLNLNGSDLAAAIGCVQLKRLPEIVSRRRALAQQVAQVLAESCCLQLGRQVDGSEGVYWFIRIHVDQSRIGVTKDTFAGALAAEGFPVSASYRHLPAEAEWFRQRQVFPPSDLPWSLPGYDDEPSRSFPCPNAVAAVESHFMLSLHENWTDREIDELAQGVRKVEAAYTS